LSPHEDPHRQHYGLTLAVLALTAMSYALLQTMVAPALPAIQHELGATQTEVSWVLTAYLLTASIATPILGRLGDIFGKERMLVLVLLLFAAGLLISALSHTLPLLIAGRAVQGAAGAIFPLAIGIIRDEFPREKVATGIGLISATFGIGGGFGLVLSGVLVDHLSYEWIFWLGLVVATVAIVCTHLFVPESPIKTPARIDWAGAALLSLTLVSLLVAITEGNSWGWGSPRIIGLFAATAVFFVAWLRFEQRATEPLVDLKLLSLRGVWTSNLATVLMGFGMFGSFILIPQFVQTDPSNGYGFGVDTTGAGLFLLPSSIVMLFAGPIAGWLGGRIGSKIPLMLGSGFAASSFALLALAHGERWQVYLAVVLMGLGIGMSFAAVANVIVESVPAANTGEATGMNAIMRTIGGALGSQVSAAVVAAHVSAGSVVPAETGYSEAFALSAAAVMLSVGAAWLVPGRLRHRARHAGVTPAQARG
jgi:EmrB/QacA subfamily drug resistance transporter